MTSSFSFNAIWTLGSGRGLRTQQPINEHFAATKKIPEKGPGCHDFGPGGRPYATTGNCLRLDGNCRESNGKFRSLVLGRWPNSERSEAKMVIFRFCQHGQRRPANDQRPLRALAIGIERERLYLVGGAL